MQEWLVALAWAVAPVALILGSVHLFTTRRRRAVIDTGTLSCDAALRGMSAPYPVRAQGGRLTFGHDRISFVLRSGTTIDLTDVGLRLTRVRLADEVETGDVFLNLMFLFEDGNDRPLALAVSEADGSLLHNLVTQRTSPACYGQVTVTTGRPRPWRTWPAVLTILMAVPLAVLAGLLLTGTTVPARIVPGDEGCTLVWSDPYQGIERRQESGCFGGLTHTKVVTPARGLPDLPLHIENLRFAGVVLGLGLLLALMAVPWRIWSWRHEDTLRTAGLPIGAPTMPTPSARPAVPPRPWEPGDLTWNAISAWATSDRMVRCAPRVGDRLRRCRRPWLTITVLLIPTVLLLTGLPALTGAATEMLTTRRAEATVTSVITDYPWELEEVRISFTTEAGEEVATNVFLHGWPQEPPASMVVNYAVAQPRWVRATPPYAGHRQGTASLATLLMLTLGGMGLGSRGWLRTRRAARRARRSGPAATVRHALVVTDTGQIRAFLFADGPTHDGGRPPIAQLDLVPAAAADLPPVGTGVVHGELVPDGSVVYAVAGRDLMASDPQPIVTDQDRRGAVDYLNAEAEILQALW